MNQIYVDSELACKMSLDTCSYTYTLSQALLIHCIIYILPFCLSCFRCTCCMHDIVLFRYSAHVAMVTVVPRAPAH